MNDLFANITATVAGRLKRAARRRMGSALLVGLAVLFVGIAIVAGFGAIGVVLAAYWGALAACLIIAGAALVIAVVLVVVADQLTKAARRRQRAEAAEMQEALLAVKAIVPDLSSFKALLIATALGVLVGLVTAKPKPKD